MGGTTASGFVIGRGTRLRSLPRIKPRRPAAVAAVGMWARRLRCPSEASCPQPSRRECRSCRRATPPWAPARPEPDAAGGCCTTRLENAHGTVVREVLYPWHPWFGLDVHVHAAATKADGVYFRCTLNGADGARWQELPAWMFDRAACAGPCIVAEPFVSLAALSALSRLLDAMGRPSPSAPQPPGLGAHSRLDRNRGEHHADGTSVTITHPAGYAATAGDDREAAPDRSVRRRHREDGGADLARVAGGGTRPPDHPDGAIDPGSRAPGRRGPVEGGQ